MDVDYPEEVSVGTSEPAVEERHNLCEAEVKRKFTGHRNAR